MSKISIGIVFFNDFDHSEKIAKYIINLSETVEAKVQEIVLLDNGSSDSTYEFLESISTKIPRCAAIRNPDCSGYGNGLRHLAKNCKSDYLLAIPGDFQFRPDTVSHFLRDSLVELNSIPMNVCVNLVATRFRVDGFYSSIRGYVWRLILNTMFRLPMKIDPASQMRLLCKHCMANLTSSDYVVDIEACVKFHESRTLKILSSKYRFEPREFGSSSISSPPFMKEFLVWSKIRKYRQTKGQ